MLNYTFAFIGMWEAVIILVLVLVPLLALGALVGLVLYLNRRGKSPVPPPTVSPGPPPLH